MSNFANRILLLSLISILSNQSIHAFSNSHSWCRTKSLVHSFVSSLRLGSENSVSDRRIRQLAELKKEEWVHNSVEYYSKVMRVERRKYLGQDDGMDPTRQEKFMVLAKKHYFALRKIKDGKPFHAEQIYRKIIEELSLEEEGTCDHAKLAVTTLLLALLLQRLGDIKGTRSVFLNFFRIAILNEDDDKECVCSAKVLQAYALFEMKRGNSLKSLEIVTKAIKYDASLAPVLQWKQFRDAIGRRTKNISMRATP